MKNNCRDIHFDVDLSLEIKKSRFFIWIYFLQLEKFVFKDFGLEEKIKKHKKIKRLLAWIYAKLISQKINLVKVIYFIICEKKAQAMKAVES